MMLRQIIVTLTPIPAFAPVLSPLLADEVAACMTAVLAGVCVEVESEGVASFVAATS